MEELMVEIQMALLPVSVQRAIRRGDPVAIVGGSARYVVTEDDDKGVN